MDPVTGYWVTVGVFLATYAALAWGTVPGLRISRAGITITGAAALLFAGVLTREAAVKAIDFDTIALLLGMMIVVGTLQISGFFTWLTDTVAARCQGAYSLLAVVMGLSGVLSAFLVNDVVCVAMTPLVLGLCQRLGRPPLPYLIGLATSSNVGSIATITGNPQNIIIGSLSGIPYASFAARLAPVALLGLLVNFVVVILVYRRVLSQPLMTSRPHRHQRGYIHQALCIKTVVVALVAVTLFFLGLPIATVALAAAGICLLDRVRTDRIFRHVDWPLLLMFAGLFIVVAAFEAQVVHHWQLNSILQSARSPILTISGLAVVLSNLVSNVPAVLLFVPLMADLPDAESGWLALAMASTCAGNLTLLGSVANLIVAESARRERIEVGFVEYLKVGIPVTLLTLTIGIVWLTWTSPAAGPIERQITPQQVSSR
jgi:Na+/H+ antiporter NhaD/arsenite permease-like protein